MSPSVVHGGVALAALWLVACAPTASPGIAPTEVEWRAALASLESLREQAPTRPYGLVVEVTLREPRSRRSFTARGALAVDPHRALRMVLLGPGGSTAIDAWVTPAAYRFEVPAIGLLRRGGEKPDPHLPVEFFRWWFLAPVDGRLLASVEGARGSALPTACEGSWFLLRRGESTVSLCTLAGPRGGLELLATARHGSGERGRRVSSETLSFRGASLAPRAGDRADYEDEVSGVRADVVVESLEADAPDPLAFLDPDHGGAR